MNREDIIKLAREAGIDAVHSWKDPAPAVELIERFAELVVAAERNSWPAEMEAMERQVNILTDALAQAKAEEREACAKVCESMRGECWAYDHDRIAAAIRARGETK